MRAVLLVVAASAAVGCELPERHGSHDWFSPAVVSQKAAPPDAGLELVDFIGEPSKANSGVKRRCNDGFVRVDYDPPWAMFCRPSDGGATDASPCVAAEVVARGSDGLVACK